MFGGPRLTVVAALLAFLPSSLAHSWVYFLLKGLKHRLTTFLME